MWSSRQAPRLLVGEYGYLYSDEGTVTKNRRIKGLNSQQLLGVNACVRAELPTYKFRGLALVYKLKFHYI